MTLGHLGDAVAGVVDGCPGLLVDGRHRCDHGLHHPDPHGVADVEPPEGGDGGVRPEAGVEAHDQLAGGARPTQPGHQLFDEPLGSPLGVGRALAHPDVEELAGPGPGGEQGVVAELVGVAVAGTVLGLAAHLTDGGVEVDDQPIALPDRHPSTHARRSVSAEHGVELTDVAEGEGPQERAQAWTAPSPDEEGPTGWHRIAARRHGRCGCHPPPWRAPGSAPCVRAAPRRLDPTGRPSR